MSIMGYISQFLATHHSKLTAIGAIATAIGVFFTASFNYANLVMSRSRQSSDLIKAFDDFSIAENTRPGRVCLEYARYNFPEEEMSLLWVEDPENFLVTDFPLRTPTAHSDLTKCLMAFKPLVITKDLEQLVGAQKPETLHHQASFYMARQVFSFLNAHEIVFAAFMYNKSDRIRICEQFNDSIHRTYLEGFFSAGRESLLKSNKSLIIKIDNNQNADYQKIISEIKGDKILRYYYPATTWYLNHTSECRARPMRWVKNYIYPLFPFLNTI